MRASILINVVDAQYEHLFQSEERQLEKITRTRLTLQYDQLQFSSFISP